MPCPQTLVLQKLQGAISILFTRFGALAYGVIEKQFIIVTCITTNFYRRKNVNVLSVDKCPVRFTEISKCNIHLTYMIWYTGIWSNWNTIQFCNMYCEISFITENALQFICVVRRQNVLSFDTIYWNHILMLCIDLLSYFGYGLTWLQWKCY